MIKKLQLPILRFPDWPTADQAAWNAARCSDDWFGDSRGLATYPESRIRVLESAYGRWLGFLTLNQPGSAIKSGIDHLDRERVQAFFDRLCSAIAAYSGPDGDDVDDWTLALDLIDGAYETVVAAILFGHTDRG